MTVFCYYHRLHFSQKHPRNLGKSFVKKEFALEMSRQGHKNVNVR